MTITYSNQLSRTSKTYFSHSTLLQHPAKPNRLPHFAHDAAAIACCPAHDGHPSCIRAFLSSFRVCRRCVCVCVRARVRPRVTPGGPATMTTTTTMAASETTKPTTRTLHTAHRRITLAERAAAAVGLDGKYECDAGGPVLGCENRGLSRAVLPTAIFMRVKRFEPNTIYL